MVRRLDLLICLAGLAGPAASGCTRENPAFDEPIASTTQGSETGDPRPDLPADSDSGEESSTTCELVGGTDMSIKVPQPCGETNDILDTYDHWFEVVTATGSTWSVKFCIEGCMQCEPLPGDLVVSPLSVADLAGPGTCLKMSGRRLGTGDDCEYHTVTIQNMSTGGNMLVLARRTELLELPPIDTNTGLLGWEPNMVVDETCDCALDPDSCCGNGQAPTLYAYEINGTVIPVGGSDTVSLGGRSYEFKAFNAFQSGECQAPIDVSWALVAN